MEKAPATSANQVAGGSVAPPPTSSSIDKVEAPANPYTTTNLTYTGKGRQAIVSKLDRIRMDTVLYQRRELSEVVRELNEETKKRDPEQRGINFMVDPNVVAARAALAGPVDPTTGLPAAAAPAEPADINTVSINIDPPLSDVRLADVIEAIVKVADKPIKYSIEDYAVVFSLRGPESEVLVTRTLKFDPEVFLPNLRQRMHLPDKSTDQEAIHALHGFLADAGLDMRPPYSAFLKERGLTLFHAPQEKIEAIERLFTELNNGRSQSEIPGPGRPPDRETVIRKLDQIRFDSPAYHEAPLIEVIRDLSWETKHHDPEMKGFGFRIKYSDKLGKMVDLSAVKVTIPAISNARLSDLLEAVVKGADKPIKYYIWAGVVFYSTEDELGFPPGMTLEQALPPKNATQPADTNNPSPSRMINRVPVLGDIPLVGKLFRSQSNAFRAESPGVGTAGEYLDPWGNPYIISMDAFGTSNSPTESAGRSGLAAGPSSALPSTSGPEQLQTRVFKLDPDTFYKGLESVSSLPVTRTNVRVVVATFFSSLGVDLSPPESVFWNDRNGGLFVRATAQDLDVIENAVEVLNRVPPQINIKTRFVEIEEEDIRAHGFDWYLGNFLMVNGAIPNLLSPFYGVLTDPQFRVVLRALEQRNGADILAAPEVTTVSGRQAQVQVVDLQTVVTGINPPAQVQPGIISTNGSTNALYQTQTMPFGPVLDVIPYLGADGYTINMTVIPTVTEFLGYDNPAIYGLTNFLDQTVLPLPHFRVRQMTVTANVRDGQTLVLIGPVTTEVIKKPDGSTETKDVSSTQKKQLIVFVTPTLVDAAGNRLHGDDKAAPGPK